MLQDSVDAIYEARKRFLVADVRYREESEALDDLALDIRVATRAGNEEEVAMLTSKRSTYASSVWYPAYNEWKASAKALMAALDVDADRIRIALS
jgi:IS5 family transposase